MSLLHKMKQQNTKYLRGLLKSKFGQCPETTLKVMCKTVLIFRFRTTIILSEEAHFSNFMSESTLNILASS